MPIKQLEVHNPEMDDYDEIIILDKDNIPFRRYVKAKLTEGGLSK